MSDATSEFDALIAAAEVEEAQAEEAKQQAPRRTRSDKGKPRGPRGSGGTSSTRDKKLAEDLLGPWALVIKALAMPMPTTAAVMATRGEKTTNAIVALAPPKLKAQLAKVSKIGPGADLAETIAMLFVAVMMDSGKLDPHSPLGMFSGVTELYEQTHEAPAAPDNVTPFPSPPFGGVPPYPGMGA